MNSFFAPHKKKFITTVITKLWFFGVLCIIIYKGILPGWQEKPADFNNYYVAAKLVFQGFPIDQFYNYEWFNNQAQEMGIKAGAKFSPFPPITAYVYMPLTFFSPLTAKRIWLVFNVLLIFVLSFRIKKILNWSLPQTLLILSLFIIPVSNSLNLGQLYLVIGVVLVELFGQQVKKNKPKILGFILGFIVSLKYLPIVFIAYLFKNKKRNLILIYMFLGVAIPSTLVFLINSEAYNIFFEHFSSHAQGNLPGQGKYAIAFQSIDSILNNLFVYDQLKNPNPFIDAIVLKPIIKFLLLGGIIGLLLQIFKKNKYQLTPVIVSIGIIGVFVMVPASASYHLLLLLWPVLCIIEWLYTFKSKQALVNILIIIFISFNLSYGYIPNINQFPTLNLLLHYPRFWGVLCLFLLLSYYHIRAQKKNYG